MKDKTTHMVSRRYVQLGLGFVFSALFLYLAAREVNLGETWRTLLAANSGYILLAIASVAVNILSKVLRWKDLLGPSGTGMPVRKLLSALLVGQLLNTFLPARLGDLSRAYTIGGLGPGRSYTLGTVVLEKMVDSLAYVLLLVTLILLIPIPSWVGNSALPLATAAIFFTVFILILTLQRPRFLQTLEKLKAKLPGSRLPDVLKHIQEGLASTEVLQNRTGAVKIIFWSLLAWGTAILTNYLALLALEIDIPLIAPVLLLVALQAGIALAAIPGHIGLFEYIGLLTLGLYGVDQVLGLSYGILLHAIVLLPPLFTGLLALWLSGFPGREMAGREALERS